MDVRFERVAEAVAAVCDFEHLALMSNKQSARPKACKVLLKPVTFECGAYTPAVTTAAVEAVSTPAAAVAAATASTAAASTAAASTAAASTATAAAPDTQQQQQQQQQPPLPTEQPPLPLMRVKQEPEAAPLPSSVRAEPAFSPATVAAIKAARAANQRGIKRSSSDTTECPSTDDDTYRGTGRSSVQQQQQYSERSRSSSRDRKRYCGGRSSSRSSSRSRRCYSPRSSYRR
jgi:hypothetical protein